MSFSQRIIITISQYLVKRKFVPSLPGEEMTDALIWISNSAHNSGFYSLVNIWRFGVKMILFQLLEDRFPALVSHRKQVKHKSIKDVYETLTRWKMREMSMIVERRARRRRRTEGCWCPPLLPSLTCSRGAELMKQRQASSLLSLIFFFLSAAELMKNFHEIDGNGFL